MVICWLVQGISKRLCRQACLDLRVTFVIMTFYEKYPQLQEKAFLTQMLTETVFTTMSLEDQQVPKNKIEEIVSFLLSNRELEMSKLKTNQVFKHTFSALDF